MADLRGSTENLLASFILNLHPAFRGRNALVPLSSFFAPLEGLSWQARSDLGRALGAVWEAVGRLQPGLSLSDAELSELFAQLGQEGLRGATSWEELLERYSQKVGEYLRNKGLNLDPNRLYAESMRNLLQSFLFELSPLPEPRPERPKPDLGAVSQALPPWGGALGAQLGRLRALRLLSGR